MTALLESPVVERRLYKRTATGCLVIATYLTPASEQCGGYVLEPRS